jgi:hypothetical protein
MHGESRKKFVAAQQASFGERPNLLEDLKLGLYLGSEAFSKECIERLKGNDHHEKPQVRSLLRSKDIQGLAVKILKGLGERVPESVLQVRKHHCSNRDIAIYILYQLGVYLNKEIGTVFGVGYTAIPGAVKRAQEYLRSDQESEGVVKKLINDI